MVSRIQRPARARPFPATATGSISPVRDPQPVALPWPKHGHSDRSYRVCAEWKSAIRLSALVLPARRIEVRKYVRLRHLEVPMRLRRRTTEVEPVNAVRRPRTWSTAQLVALLIGAGFIVLGAVALNHTGFSTSHLYEPSERVWTLGHTPLLAIVELGFGIAMVIAALRPLAGRALMMLLSLAAIGSGVVILADAWPRRVHHWFGTTHRNGWLYVIAGGIGVAAVLFAPTITRSRRRIVRHDGVADDTERAELVDADR